MQSLLAIGSKQSELSPFVLSQLQPFPQNDSFISHVCFQLSSLLSSLSLSLSLSHPHSHPMFVFVFHWLCLLQFVFGAQWYNVFNSSSRIDSLSDRKLTFNGPSCLAKHLIFSGLQERILWIENRVDISWILWPPLVRARTGYELYCGEHSKSERLTASNFLRNSLQLLVTVLSKCSHFVISKVLLTGGYTFKKYNFITCKIRPTLMNTIPIHDSVYGYNIPITTLKLLTVV